MLGRIMRSTEDHGYSEGSGSEDRGHTSEERLRPAAGRGPPLASHQWSAPGLYIGVGNTETETRTRASPAGALINFNTSNLRMERDTNLNVNSEYE